MYLTVIVINFLKLPRSKSELSSGFFLVFSQLSVLMENTLMKVLERVCCAPKDTYLGGNDTIFDTECVQCAAPKIVYS